MSGIIQVDYTVEGKKLTEKLREHLGIHKLDVQLKSGGKISGLLSEMGEDYILLLEENSEVLVSVHEVAFIRYHNQ